MNELIMWCSVPTCAILAGLHAESEVRLFVDCQTERSHDESNFAPTGSWCIAGKFFGPVPGTSTATVAGNLVQYLVDDKHFATKIPLTYNFATNAVSDARPGDIIAYDWYDTGRIDHLAMVVDIAPGQYPEVSEWGTQNIRESYQKRGWTWSALHHEWLQREYPKVKAELIHFNP